VALLTGAGLVCFFFGVEHMKKSWTIRQLTKRVAVAERAAGINQPVTTDTPSDPYATREGPTL
jgi:hypothetical protein